MCVCVNFQSLLVNKEFFEYKNEEHRGDIKCIGDKIGMVCDADL